MVQHGWALAYRRFSYVSDEDDQRLLLADQGFATMAL
jgi:hypothetical protein